MAFGTGWILCSKLSFKQAKFASKFSWKLLCMSEHPDFIFQILGFPPFILQCAGGNSKNILKNQITRIFKTLRWTFIISLLWASWKKYSAPSLCNHLVINPFSCCRALTQRPSLAILLPRDDLRCYFRHCFEGWAFSSPVSFKTILTPLKSQHDVVARVLDWSWREIQY